MRAVPPPHGAGAPVELADRGFQRDAARRQGSHGEVENVGRLPCGVRLTDGLGELAGFLCELGCQQLGVLRQTFESLPEFAEAGRAVA